VKAGTGNQSLHPEPHIALCVLQRRQRSKESTALCACVCVCVRVCVRVRVRVHVCVLNEGKQTLFLGQNEAMQLLGRQAPKQSLQKRCGPKGKPHLHEFFFSSSLHTKEQFFLKCGIVCHKGQCHEQLQLLPVCQGGLQLKRIALKRTGLKEICSAACWRTVHWNVSQHRPAQPSSNQQLHLGAPTSYRTA
jgi:hypothetical protein